MSSYTIRRFLNPLVFQPRDYKLKQFFARLAKKLHVQCRIRLSTIFQILKLLFFQKTVISIALGL